MPVQLLIGTYTRGTGAEGIYLATWDERRGSLHVGGVAAVADNPSYLVWSQRHRCVYAASEVTDFAAAGQGAVTMYERDGDALRLRGQRPSGGGLPCSLALDGGERHLAVANYAGTVAILPVSDGGTLGPASIRAHVESSVHPRRQASAHPHGVTFAGNELIVPDLGADAVFRYRIDRGAIVEHAPALRVAAGAGPRLWVEHPRLACSYLVNELDNTVNVYRRNADGRVAMQRLSTLAEDFGGRSAASDIHPSDDGQHLYVANRGEDSIAAFLVAADGTLVPIGRTSTHGTHPRAFALAPCGNWLLVANRDSNIVVVFRRDVATGGIVGPVSEAVVPAAACLLFLPGG